ncbi:hypothetical protein QFC22_002314 [Naganishia vaughanmartiniae]|uniref:Uncharacterized protein n=1 Tax=Naganishia vaughanmartiniae TaxID=1424756 RepID=A0ACC2XE94_9TREE|nr:hypothetical protein QFC22_002314 [Naganishia vaughanmartiniae]
MAFRLSHTNLFRTTSSPVIGKVRLFSTSRAVFELRTSGRPLQCHVGVSFASKDSPPFATREEADASASKGFQTGPIARWKDQMLGQGTLRTELLKPSSEDGKALNDVEQAKHIEAVISDRKRWGAGEDFFFTRQGVREFGEPVLLNDLPSLQKTVIGVSDGVGGWAASGHDPSLFSQALMWHAYKQSERNPSASVLKLLTNAYDGVMKEENVPCGSATACLSSFDSSTGILESINLGDSGFSIIRDGEVFFEAPAQTHYFNCPRQLTKPEKGSDSSGMAMDLPEHGDLYSQKLQKGDMVVLYTDGLSDNVHNSQILALLKHVDSTLASPTNAFLLPEEKALERARLFADVLVGYARLCMSRQDVVSPFEQAAAKQGIRYPGGKIDEYV